MRLLGAATRNLPSGEIISWTFTARRARARPRQKTHSRRLQRLGSAGVGPVQRLCWHKTNCKAAWPGIRPPHQSSIDQSDERGIILRKDKFLLLPRTSNTIPTGRPQSAVRFASLLPCVPFFASERKASLLSLVSVQKQRASGCTIRVASNDSSAPNPNLSILQITPVVKRIVVEVGLSGCTGSRDEMRSDGLPQANGWSADQ